MFSLQLFTLFQLLLVIFCEFNEDFAQFLDENYGKAFLDTLQRTDLGDNGSFGGKENADQEIEKDPILFVHGVSDIAGGKMKALASKFRKKGYNYGELYGTSYSGGAKGNPLQWADYSMKCDHVKQIRTMILAVRYYTKRNVDIIAYSLGVPIARKAVLGGKCVDTQEDIGGNITNYVDTFVGVAGPNHGISLQIAGISIPGCLIGAIPIIPICSRVIGLFSGLCPTESSFLTDINENEHYEGKHVYSIYSKTDNWIGYEVCGKFTAQMSGEDGHKMFPKYTHDEIVELTDDVQHNMISKHTINTDTDDDDTTTSSEQKKSSNRSKIRGRPEKSNNSEERSRQQRNIEDDYLSETEPLPEIEVATKFTSKFSPPPRGHPRREEMIDMRTESAPVHSRPPAIPPADSDSEFYHTNVRIIFEN